MPTSNHDGLARAIASMPLLASKSELIRYITTNKDVPKIVKSLAIGLALVSDSDYIIMRDTFVEIVRALGETSRGRAILLDMGLDVLVSSDEG